MSRGPGLRQRAILAALERTPAVTLGDLLGDGCTRSESVAMYRAAIVLQAKGRIGMFYFWDAAAGKRGYVLHRPGTDVKAHARALGLVLYYDYWLRER
jgi:hypothetical protein